MTGFGVKRTRWKSTSYRPLLLIMVFVLIDPFRVNTAAPICFLQGRAFSSPYVGSHVTVQGVVTLDRDNTGQKGFHLQQDPCDQDPATSDAIYVYLGEQVELVNTGDWVQVQGVVGEYFGLTEILSTPQQVQILSQGNPLPPPVELNPPFDNAQARAYYESLESMRVSLDDGLVVGPTDRDERTWLVRSDLGITRVFKDDLAGTGELICVDDGGNDEITPQVKSGDQVQDIDGVLDFRDGLYCVQLLQAPLTLPAFTRQDSQGPSGLEIQTFFTFSIGTVNLMDLFDMLDDPLTEDDVLSATEYQRRLHKRALALREMALGDFGAPTVLAVQEVENQAVLEALLTQPEITVDYDVIWQDGPDRRGMDIALIYQTSRVHVLGYQVYQGCTALVDGLGPDGNLDVYAPENALTCDLNGDEIPDGNRLFSRPPLVVQLRLCRTYCSLLPLSQLQANDDEITVWVIANHWKSKTQDTNTVAYTLPRRIEQAGFVSTLVQDLQSTHPQDYVVVVGDFNDDPGSPPMEQLTDQGLRDLSVQAPHMQRYTYIYRGISEVLDNVLLAPQPSLIAYQVSPLHVNADFPVMYTNVYDSVHRSSDHDPLNVQFLLLEQKVFLPILVR